MQKVIEVENLTKIFNKSTIAVDNISFEINQNEVFGLIGPNGSGKTTTQRMLATILQPSTGKISFYGKILNDSSGQDVRQKIGYIPQGNCLYDDLTIQENMFLFSQPFSIEGKTRLRKIAELLERLDIADRKNSLVKNLSGGLAKRASIATSLVHNPEILFLDEITMGLDPNSRYKIWKLIQELKKETTIIFTTHYMDEAERLCDRLAILSQGKILELDTPQKILSKYKTKDLNDVIGKIIEAE